MSKSQPTINLRIRIISLLFGVLVATWFLGFPSVIAGAQFFEICSIVVAALFLITTCIVIPVVYVMSWFSPTIAGTPYESLMFRIFKLLGGGIALGLVLFILSGILYSKTGARLPLFNEKEFSAAMLAEAVNHFINIGEEDAIQELNGLAFGSSFLNETIGFSRDERVGWVCRIVFEPKDAKHLRPPRFGTLEIPYSSVPTDMQPLYPVVNRGNTYFVLSEGYEVVGDGENRADYIRYCSLNGAFRKKPIDVPTRAQGLEDAVSLRRSEVWLAIDWTNQEKHGSKLQNEQNAWEFIQHQASTIP